MMSQIMPSDKTHTFFATAPKFMSELLAEELKGLGATVVAIKLAGVTFQGTLAIAYRACLWSRLANRILFPLVNFDAPDPDTLYRGVQQIDWSRHLSVDGTFAVDFSSTGSQITHTQYGAQRVKDAIADQFRSRYDKRPSVQLNAPQVMVNVYVLQDRATVSIDLAGESLHKRGYRQSGGDAPLKENLAAALLWRANWPAIAKQGGALVDLMCGSGSLPIEAALMAGNIAPGLLRRYFGFLGWRQHQSKLWEDLCEEAKKQQCPITSPIVGFDADSHAISQGLRNVARAQLDEYIHLEKRELAVLRLSQALEKNPGLVIVNPPYGERLGEAEALLYLYKNIGNQFREHFVNWQGAVYTGNPELGKRMGVRAKKYYAFYNGPIPCRLLLFDIKAENFVNDNGLKKPLAQQKETDPLSCLSENDPVHMFINRLQKNIKHLQPWVKRQQTSCYRLYDADLPEYNVAIDRYGEWLHVQEYAPPKTVDEKKALQRIQAIKKVLPSVSGIPIEHIFYKLREKQTREKQYEKFAVEENLHIVQENQAKLLVNLTDYLDTGIFLDQRDVRQKIYQLAKGKHFLNLFAYTGTASVFAALGGAYTTTTVDLSATYLGWAKKNMALNGLGEKQNHFVQADVLAWVEELKQQYDLMFVAPPVFSRSKRMESTFDVQRDHSALLEKLHPRLTREGKLIFATHKKNFELDTRLLQFYQWEDWSKKTLPIDFQRKANAYYCYVLQRREGA